MAKRIFTALILCALLICSCLLVAGCQSDDQTTQDGGGNRIPTDDLYIVDVQMVTPPTVSTYADGDIFDPTGMVLKVIWNDGLEQLVQDGKNCIFSPAGAITADTEEIKATYDDKIFTLPVTVNKIVGITAVSQPARTLYEEGEAFSATGLTILGVLENGEIGKRVLTDYTLSENAKELSTSDTKVVVSYDRNGAKLTCDIPVTVVSEGRLSTFEVEDGIVSNGTIVTTGSNLLNFTSGGFIKNLKKNGSIVINIPAKTQTTASLRFVLSSYEDSLEDSMASMDIKINEAIKIAVNGVEIKIGDDQILSGGLDDARGQYSRFCRWYEFAIDNVQLKAGNNTFVITSKVDVTAKNDLHSICYDMLRVFTAKAGEIGESGAAEEGVEAGGEYTFEAEEGTVSNGTKVYTTSSLLNFTSGGFVKNLRKNGSIVINIPAKAQTTASLRFVMSSYESSPTDPLTSIDIKINEAIKIEVNGVEIEIGDDQILPGGPDDERGEYSRFCHFYELVIDNVQLEAGNNTFVITSKVDANAKDDLHSICYDMLRVITADAGAAD